MSALREFLAVFGVAIVIFAVVVGITVALTPDRGQCLETERQRVLGSTGKTAFYYMKDVCVRWEYPEGRPRS